MEVCEPSEQTGNSVPPTLVNDDLEEEARMMNQAKLGHLSRRFIVRRCWVQSRTKDSYGEGPPMTTYHYPEVLQKHEERWVTRLSGVTVLPSVGGTGPGTIEAHLNGFIYSASGFRKVFMHDDVEWYFYRLGSGMQPPLMQFHLQRPIKIRNTETKDIQFRLVPTRFSSSSSCDEDLRNFIDKVQETQFACNSESPFTPIDFQALDEFEFSAADLPTGAPTSCALTRYALVVLEEPPYLVVPLGEIQFVNLACFGDGIEMTVVFNELDRDVLQLGSIPMGYLTDIKHRLNREDVKYYVNSLRPDWSDKVRLHRDLPEVFLAGGGWDFLEDCLTLAKYPHFDPHSVREDYDRALKDIENMEKIARVDPESQEWLRILQVEK